MVGENMGLSEKIGNTNKVWRIGELHPGRRCVTLMITHDCNLHCSYCYEHHKSKKEMPVELAKSIIKKEFEYVRNSTEFKELEIDFMGGEPLMNFALIKEIVEWLESSPQQVPYICFATTNGTLLNDESKHWFRLHKQTIVLGISYDGDSKMQLLNRGTENGAVDLAFFHDLWPDQAFHIVIAKKTVSSVAQGILFLQEKGYPIEVALAQGEDWTREDAITYQKQLKILMTAYLYDQSLPPMNRLTTFLLVDNSLSSDSKMHKFCGTGTHMIAYDVDGKEYGCHMFTPVVVAERALERRLVDWNNLDEESQCIRCCLRQVCGTCLGYNLLQRRAPEKRDFRFCLMTLAELQAACEFQIHYFSRKESLNDIEMSHSINALKSYAILRRFDLKKDYPPFLM